MTKIVFDPELILDIGQAYQTGLSYSGVARKLGCGEGTVKKVMRKHWPGAIRTRGPKRAKPVAKTAPAPELLSLAALGLYAVGKCVKCRIEIVSETPGKPQFCRFCKNPAARFSGEVA